MRSLLLLVMVSIAIACSEDRGDGRVTPRPRDGGTTGDSMTPAEDVGPIVRADGSIDAGDGSTTGMDATVEDLLCPGATLTICDLKAPESVERPALGSTIRLENVVVTSPPITVARTGGTDTLRGIFVQDQNPSATLAGRYSGILIVYAPAELPNVPAVLSTITVDGTFDEFGSAATRQKQVRATQITVTGAGSVTPIEANASQLATGGSLAADYEGVLVRVAGVTITSDTVLVNGMQVFGAFQVDASLIVSGAIYELRNVVIGETIVSLTGILRTGTAPFEAGQSLMTPRFESDIVLGTPSTTVTRIRDIQDPSSPNHPTMCVNETGSQTIGRCAIADLRGVVVTAAGGYVSTNLRSFWVQDAQIADGRYAGIKVIYNPSTAPFVPMRGDLVDVAGEIIEYRRATQIQYPTITLAGTRAPPNPISLSPFDVARTVAPESSPYEGVLVDIGSVQVIDACIEDTLQRDHGEWIVTGDVHIGTSFEYTYNGDSRPAGTQCVDGCGIPTGLCSCSASSRPNDQRMAGDTFIAIRGVMDFAFGEYQLMPRDDADLIR